MKRVSAVFSLLLWVLSSSGPSAADVAIGIAAYERGDFATALREFRAEAERGNPVAQHNLGVMHEEGRGVPRDYGEAARWYFLAAEQGYADAQNNLGLIYRLGRGVSRNPSEAIRWYRLAAAQGALGANTNLGNMYHAGEGIPRNFTEAARLHRLDAIQGSAKAQSNLGNMYLHGEGVPQSDSEAARWYREAAERADAYAQKFLAFLYGEGRGVPRDNVQAYMWSSLAAAQGDDEARSNLNAFESIMSREQIAEAQRLAAAFQPRAETPVTPKPITSQRVAPLSTGLPSAIVRNVQSHLKALGYDPGPIDGMMGQRTSRAIEAFQRDRGIEPDGVASTTLEAMLSGLMGDSTQQPIPRQ